MDISVSINEALRYAGKRKSIECDELTLSKFNRFASEVTLDSQPVFSARVLDIAVSENKVIIEQSKDVFESAALSKHLLLCKKALIFSATLGIEVDRKTARLSVSSMEDALIYDACATALTEDYCDKICEDFERRYGKLTSRFSPGYSDLAISYQTTFLALTDAARKAGINMNPSYLLSPMKSVTAIAGIIEGGEK